MPIPPLNAGNKILDWLKSLPPCQWVSRNYQKALDALKVMVDDGWDQLVTYYHTDPNWAFGLAWGFYNWLAGLLDIETRPLPDDPIVAAIEDLMGKIYGPAMDLAESPAVQTFVRETGELYYDPLMTLLGITPGDLMGDAGDRLHKFIGTISLLSAFGPTISNAVETMTGGRIKQAGSAIKEAYFNLGLGFTTWQITSPAVNAGIGDELKRAVNIKYRPTRFTMAQTMDAFALGEITRADVDQTLREAGFPEDYLDKIVNMAYRPLTSSQIITGWHNGLKSSAWAVEQMGHLGFSPESIEYIMQLEQPPDALEDRKTYVSTLRKGYKEGLLSEGEFRSLLTEMNFSDTEIELEVALYAMQDELDERTLTASQVKAAYDHNVIGREEVYHYLREANYGDESIAKLLATWDAQRAPAVLKLNSSTIKMAYAQNILTELEARELLVTLGYSDKSAAIILQTVRFPDAPQPIGPSISACMAALRTGLIDEEKFTTLLTERKLSAAAITIYLQLATYVGPESTRILTRTDILAAYRADIITENDCLISLVGMGYAPEDAILLVMLNPPTEKTLAEKHFGTNAIMAAYTFKIINRDRAYNILASTGMTTDMIESILALGDMRLDGVLPDMSVASLLLADRQEIITSEALWDILDKEGFDDWDILTAITLVNTPDYSPQRDLTVSNITGARKDGKIGPLEARARLLLLGYDSEDLELVLYKYE